MILGPPHQIANDAGKTKLIQTIKPQKKFHGLPFQDGCRPGPPVLGGIEQAQRDSF